MLVMLETGVRVNEASNIMISDVDRKMKLLTIRSETAKTREERYLPISAKTMKYLDKLITIAENNNELYLFTSSYWNCQIWLSPETRIFWLQYNWLFSSGRIGRCWRATRAAGRVLLRIASEYCNFIGYFLSILRRTKAINSGAKPRLLPSLL